LLISSTRLSRSLAKQRQRQSIFFALTIWLLTAITVKMSLFRNAIATARNSGSGVAAQPMRSSIARQATRQFASETPKPVQQAQQAASQAAASGSSNLPLILGLGGLGGLGAWYYMGGFGGDVKKPELPKALSIGGGALNKNEFKEFTLKEVKPYNHDSST
jgi:hypothetical protein